MLPDLGLSTVPSIIASSTTGYLVQFSPIFLLVGGLLLAVGVIFLVIEFFQRIQYDKAFELESVYSSADLTDLNDAKLDKVLSDLRFESNRIKKIEEIERLQDELRPTL